MTKEHIEKVISHNRRGFAAHQLWKEFETESEQLKRCLFQMQNAAIELCNLMDRREIEIPSSILQIVSNENLSGGLSSKLQDSIMPPTQTVASNPSTVESTTAP